MGKIKYPQYHITDHPTDFYVFYRESDKSKALWSGWIKGNPSLWHKINKAKRDDRNNMIIDLAKKVV
jgi:hypothetical protein